MNSRGVTPPAVWGCIKTRPPVAHSLTLSDVPCEGAPKSRRAPPHPHASPVSVTRWTARNHQDTIRCDASLFKYKCTICRSVYSEWILDDYDRRCHASMPSATAPEVLAAGLPTNDISDIKAPHAVFAPMDNLLMRRVHVPASAST